MSLFSTIFKYSAAQLNYQSPVYHISYNTYEHTLPKIKPSLVPERTYNTLSDDIFNTLGDSNRDFLNTPYEITADTDYNSYVSKVIDKFAVKNTLRTLSHDANNDQQLIADYMPQQDLLLDLFKPNINLLAVDTGSNHGDQNNNIFTADSSLAHSENYFGYEGIDIFTTEIGRAHV